MIQLQCQRQNLSGVENSELNVGSHIVFVCRGDKNELKDELFKPQLSWQILGTKEDAFKSHVFSVVKKNDGIVIDMTFYVTGKIDFPDLLITNSESNVSLSSSNTTLSLGAQSFIIQSVLQKQQEQPPKPYGYAFSKLSLAPGYILVMMLLLFAFLVGGIYFVFDRRRQKQLQAEIQKFNTATPPNVEFYRVVRKVDQIQNPTLDVYRELKTQIDRALLIYILRRFQVPVFHERPSQIARRIKKQLPRQEKIRRQIFHFIRDARRSANKITECGNLHSDLKKMYAFVDECENVLAKEGR